MNKKFALLLVLAALVMGTVSSAAAAEIKASGQWQIDAQLAKNWDFSDRTEDKTFDIGQRVRTAFSFIANENLKGVLDTQIGTANWGAGALAIGAGRTPNVTTGTSGSAVAGDGNIMLRKGYVDFKWPGTKVNFLVGYQTLSLPAAVGGGSAILDDQFAAAAVVVPVTEGISVVGGYGRLLDSQAFGAGNTLVGHGTSADVVFAIANLDFKGFKVQPFAAYANAGYQSAGAALGATALNGFMGPNSSSQEGLRAYWGGAAFTMTAFDPFKVMADFNYGKATYNNAGSSLNKASGGRSGWMADLAIDYTGLSMMTPSFFAAYSSGENGNSTKGSGKSERMPIVGAPQNYALGSFWLQGGDALGANGIAGTPATSTGFWALGLSLKDIKFVDKLTHTAHLIYFKGTNDPEYLKELTTSAGATNIRNATYGQFLTTKDSLIELDFNTKYQIYDELSVALELGYINASIDKDTWRTTAPVATNSDFIDGSSKSAYKAALIVGYSF